MARLEVLRSLPPAEDPYLLWVEAEEASVYFIEAVLLWIDNIANVRREYRVEGGRTWFKMYVTKGGLEEVLDILRELKRFVYIGSVRVEAP